MIGDVDDAEFVAQPRNEFLGVFQRRVFFEADDEFVGGYEQRPALLEDWLRLLPR